MDLTHDEQFLAARASVRFRPFGDAWEERFPEESLTLGFNLFWERKVELLRAWEGVRDSIAIEALVKAGDARGDARARVAIREKRAPFDCDCSCGSQTCAHVTALLFMVRDFIRESDLDFSSLKAAPRSQTAKRPVVPDPDPAPAPGPCLKQNHLDWLRLMEAARVPEGSGAEACETEDIRICFVAEGIEPGPPGRGGAAGFSVWLDLPANPQKPNAPSGPGDITGVLDSIFDELLFRSVSLPHRDLLEDLARLHRPAAKGDPIRPAGRVFERPLREMLESGCVLWEEPAFAPEAAGFREGAPRRVGPAWIAGGEGEIETALRFLDTGQPAWLAGTEPALYLDPATGSWGAAELDLPPGLDPELWLAAPPCPPEASESMRERLRELFGEDAAQVSAEGAPPLPAAAEIVGDEGPAPGSATDSGCPPYVGDGLLPPEFAFAEIDGEKTPPELLLRVGRYRVLRLEPGGESGERRIPRESLEMDCGDLDFRRLPAVSLHLHYDGIEVLRPVRNLKQSIRGISGDRVVSVDRDLESENTLLEQVEGAGLVPLTERWGFDQDEEELADSLYCFDDVERDGEMVRRLLDLLDGGFEHPRIRVVPDPACPLECARPESWFADFEEEEGSSAEWLRFDCGYLIGGQRVSLLDAVVRYLGTGRGSAAALLRGDLGEEAVFLEAPPGSGRYVAVPASQLRPILQHVSELLDTAPEDGKLPIHLFRAAQIREELEESGAYETPDPSSRLREIRERCRDFSGVRSVELPAGLRAELRPYQREGLSWLQFLREFGLNGILADDMGLGKTVQTLACLLLEKESGRSEGAPSLIVAPTSVLHNWVNEAARFAPDLRVLLLHGPKRHERAHEIAACDLVVTSYPLIERDRETHEAVDWHYVVLDEAQVIKNPKSQTSEAVSRLRSRHRLCLTGTPMENHLGELWNLLNFLVPGFFGSLAKFKQVWQRPIERDGNRQRRDALVRRIGPLILRRTREAVLAELPPRTEILHRIELHPEQAKLYEAVRAALDRRVREALATQGMGRSHLIILDALLKLRQICCHPRLLKTASAQTVDESAKLDAFCELVVGLVEERRKILVFSQFTSMLEILQASLQRLRIPYVTLTGSTRDREGVVSEFQEGAVPVFLISLKAGGAGLNLTAADVVIHYDPWWNPAVEEQATARAHRMGQEKPVFVYRLVTEGTIEERILELQERKAELARDILAAGEGDLGTGETRRLDASDLEALLAPVG